MDQRIQTMAADPDDPSLMLMTLQTYLLTSTYVPMHSNYTHKHTHMYMHVHAHTHRVMAVPGVCSDPQALFSWH